MIKFLVTIFIFTISLSGGRIDDPISVGSISFVDAKWDNVYNISNSKQRIANLTRNNKAVVLYFFEVCFS